MARSGDLMAEVWKPVPGHGNAFVASSLGRIARVVGHSGASGYQQISFKRSMKPLKSHSMGKKWPEQSRGYAHHLVALAFLGSPPDGKSYINHKNNNRSDNRPENLEWCSQRENVLHAWATGRIPRERRQRIPVWLVAQIVEQRNAGRNYQQIADALGVSIATVGNRLRDAGLGRRAA